MVRKRTIYIYTDRPVGGVSPYIFGQFIEHLGRCIYGGIYVGEDSTIPNIKGFRKDVLEKVKAIRPSIIRWPGGNFVSGYHWEDGIGPKDKRPIRYDLAWGQEEPNQFGTNEFIEWVKLVGAEPYIVVNAGNGTPEEAARWVEYTNKDGGTYYSMLRKRYGYEKPFNVKIWGIGNELYGKWQVGYCIDGKECARRTVEFANEMKKVDPTIKLVAVGDADNSLWNYWMVRYAGEYFDYLSIHTYIHENPYLEHVAMSELIKTKIEDAYHMIRVGLKDAKLNKKIWIAYDEWNVWKREAVAIEHTQITNLSDAILTAAILNTLIKMSSIVKMANFAQTVNVLPLILTKDDGDILLTPQYYVFYMYANNFGGKALETKVDSDYYYSKTFEKYIEYIDVAATRDNDKVYVYIVNRDKDEDYECSLLVKNFDVKCIKHVILTSDDVKDKNDWNNKEKIKPVEAERKEKLDSITIPKHSVNLLILEK